MYRLPVSGWGWVGAEATLLLHGMLPYVVQAIGDLQLPESDYTHPFVEKGATFFCALPDTNYP